MADNLTVWGAICAAVGWLVKLEHWKGKVLTRQEHHDLCEDRQKQLDKKLDTILTRLDIQDKEARQHRHRMSNLVQSIEIKVAVLQTQRGQAPTGDTGRFKLDD